MPAGVRIGPCGTAFGDFVLDTDRYELCRGGEPVHVEPQVFDVLALLVANRHRVVPKTELLDTVWGDRFVCESALTKRIKRPARPSATTAPPRGSSRPSTAVGTGSSPI